MKKPDASDGFPTNAESSGVKLDRKELKSLMRRNDRDGLISVFGCLVLLGASGIALHFLMDSVLKWPMVVIYGGILCTFTYALSHECAHGTAFRTRWINELVFWITSFVHLEEHNHRRYTHASHHTYTYFKGLDAQIPAKFPMTFADWLKEMSGLTLLQFHVVSMVRAMTFQYTDVVRQCVPETELPKLTRNAWIYFLLYCGIGIAIYSGANFLLWYLVLPRILGAPIMMSFTILQHMEMDTNQLDLRQSTSSFKTNRFARFVYLNMNYHVEHHMFPTVPFHSLPDLHGAVKDQLLPPDNGFFRTNLWGLKTVIMRSLGKAPMHVLGRTPQASSS